MLVAGSTGRRRRLGSAGVIGLAVAALALSACSSSTDGSAVATTSVKPPAPAAQVSFSPGDQVSPVTPITVKVANGKLTTVTVTNAAKGNTVKGDVSADGLTWTSSEPLGYGATYNVVADATNADGKKTEQKSTVTTITPQAQAYPALTPAPPGQGQTFGVGQIFGVSFDVAITDKSAAEKALTVTSTPPQAGAWYWLDAKTVHYRPEKYWQAGTTVKLDANLYGVNLGGGVYGKTDRSVTYTIHDSWVAQADGNTKQMAILHNGAVVNTMPISLGKDQTPTHDGPHVISDKQQQVVMDSCTYGVCQGQPGYYKSTEYWDLRISNDGEFVHENPNTVNQQGSSNVSHGCVNLSPDNAKWFFDHFNLGDVVEVTNAGGGKLPLWDTFGDWELSWAEWQKGSAIKG
ncbi:L,D-transpeptidase [Kutzneria chonburiensis]|uniref:Ig-like domain-containing protein n=1 Tax=Kutzneria chonburiensis TaxID=1483604 RepID=A0ABV6N9D7_9PSEU